MKIKNKSIIYSVFFLLFLTCGFSLGMFVSSPMIISSVKNFASPKSSAGEITVITPENKTYTEAMSGYYSATYGFENDKDGIPPDNWVANDLGGTVNIFEEFDGHKKVLRLYDTSTTYGVIESNYFSDQIKGSVELWFQKTSGSTCCYFILSDSSVGSHAIETKADCADSGLFQLLDGVDGTLSSDGGYADNTWFHVKIDFDCASDKVNFSVNSVMLFENKNFYTSVDKINVISLGTNSFRAGTWYSDAVGFSWDPNYNIGDNLDEGLLLSYENTTNLDWKGYSLDGQANKTILGNTTIPMPSDGVHSIQVFGNDSVGTMYESDLRYFAVATSAPEITIISPTDSEIFGSSAPTYGLSITGLYDTIWYTLDGGATNYTTNSLTGTLNQAAWAALADGIITITFFANNSAGMEGSAQVMVIKLISSEPPIPPGIPGYNIIALIGLTLAVTLILAKRKLKK